MKAKNLKALCKYLNTVDTTKIGLHLLPKFGGFKPACSGGVFSWDEKKIIIHDGIKFIIEPRSLLDVFPEGYVSKRKLREQLMMTQVRVK